MADVSGSFSWKLFSGPRRCRSCGREPLKIADVGEHRRKYPGKKDEFLCRECQQHKVDALVERTRHGLGLENAG